MISRDPTSRRGPVRRPEPITIGRSPLALLVLFAWAVAGLLATATPMRAAEAEAVDVVFVLDNSGSMKQNDPDFLTREAVVDFAAAIAADASVDARVGVVLFDGEARLVRTLAPITAETSGADLDGALAPLDFSGQRTNSPAGIERALYELRRNGREGARQAIVFLSDGRIDTGDRDRDLEAHRWLREDLAAESQSAGVRIFGVAFTEDADYPLMQALARRTAASYYRAFEARELASVIDDVLARVSQDRFYALASLDADRIATPAPTAASESGRPDGDSQTGGSAGADREPDVAAGPSASDARDGVGMIGLLPVVALLIGGSLLWIGRKRQHSDPSAVLPPAFASAADSPLDEAPAAQLLDVGGHLGEAGKPLSLAARRTRIGRDAHNDLVLPDDTISSEHAAIEYRDGRYWLEDLRSTNGTRLGERRLEPDERVPLKGGDHIRLADIDLMFAMAGYVPGGATVFLSSSSSPAIARPEPVAPAEAPERISDARDEPAERPVEEALLEPDVAPMPDPVKPQADADLADDAQGDPEAEARAASENGPEAVPELPIPSLDPEPVSDDVVFVEDRERLDPAPVVDLDPELASVTPIGPHVEHPLAAAAEAEDAAASDESDDDEAGEGPRDAAEVQEAPVDAPLADESDAAVARAEAPADEPEATDSAYRACLDYHLDRVAEIAPPFAEFVAAAFDDEIRAATAFAGLELMEDARASGRIGQREYTHEGVRYVVLAVPGAMDEACARFADAFGGFTRLLSEQLQSDSFLADGCRTLAVVSFGEADDAPWVSLSIVPDEGADPRIDLLSYEFLSESERREIEPSVDPEISQSGLG